MDLPKEETGGKKKKQKKSKANKTQTLNDFLATGTTFAKDQPKRTGSWADAMEEKLDAEEVSTSWQGGSGGGGGGVFDRSQLPSAPRKAQARNIDMRRLPKAPPYTVYLGNLSYECSEDDIFYFFERRNLKVKEVRLPTDSGTSRLKGFGYAELESVSALLEALELSGENLRNRAVTIDLATSKSGGELGITEREREGLKFRRQKMLVYTCTDGDGPRDRYRRDSDDRTASDWRRGSAEDRFSPSRDHQNGPEFYGGGRYDRPRGGRGYGDDYRGGGGGGGYEGRGRRGYGSGGWNERPEYRDNRHGDRRRNEYTEGGYGWRRPDDRYDHRGPFRHSDDGGYGRGEYEQRRCSPPLRSEPQERPRLQLQPRSKPVDSAPADGRSSIFGAARPVDTASREQEIEEKLRREEERVAMEEERAQREKGLREEREKVTVFGGARPVDTASREKEIEEKLRRQEEELARKGKEEGERRGSERERRGSERERRGSERERRGSERERRGSDRERRGSDWERRGSEREWLPEDRGRRSRGQYSRSPEGESGAGQSKEEGEKGGRERRGHSPRDDRSAHSDDREWSREAHEDNHGQPLETFESQCQDRPKVSEMPRVDHDREDEDKEGPHEDQDKEHRRRSGDSEAKEHSKERGRWDHSKEGETREQEGWSRGRRKGSWRDGESRGRRPPARGDVESSEREQGTETGREWQGVGRRGGGRGGGKEGDRRGGGKREREGERSHPGRDRRRGNPPSESAWSRGKPHSLATRDRDETRELPPPKKYEEPVQPTFSQPSRYAMLDLEDHDESARSDKGEGAGDMVTESADD